MKGKALGNNLFVAGLFALSLGLAACKSGASDGDSAGPQPPAAGEPAAQTALINGRVYTVDGNSSWAEAVLIRDGRISFVGSTAEARKHIGERTEVIDLEGKMVLPGLHDVHAHPMEASSGAVTCLLDSAIAPDRQMDTLKDCADHDIGIEWVLGAGHALESLLAMERSPRELLDEAIPDRPAAIMEETSHSVWVNSRALALAGISRDSADPKGGAILRDAETGEPNGVLLDTAGDLVFDLAFAPNAALDAINYQAVVDGMRALAENGITSLVDGRLYYRRGYLEAWERAEREDQLTARTVLSLWAYPLADDGEQLAALKRMYRNDPDSLLRVSQIKFYSDGILHNSTAALLEPYRDYFEEVGPYGLNYFDEQRLTRYIRELETAGFDMHIHAIGARGVRESLNAIEAAAVANGPISSYTAAGERRHRLTHVEMVHPDDQHRFAQLGVIADFQLAGEFTRPENFHWMEYKIGRRAHDMLPVRNLYDAGATITLSSDWDVSTLSPFVGMQHALEQGAQSLPGLDAAIRAYTINGAYLMRQEERAGSIELGNYAVLVVIDRNIFEIPVAEIGQTRVLMTMLEGEVVYEQR